MKYVNGPLKQRTVAHTDCCIVWTYACLLKAPKALSLFNLVNSNTRKSVYVHCTTIIYLNEFHVYEILILFDVLSRGKCK